MKTCQAKQDRPFAFAQPYKQSPLKNSNAQAFLKLLKHGSNCQSNRSSKPFANLESPASSLQKIGSMVHTPRRSTSTMNTLKQRYLNSTTNDTLLRDLSTQMTKSQLDKFISEKSLEISIPNSHIASTSRVHNTSSSQNHKKSVINDEQTEDMNQLLSTDRAIRCSPILPASVNKAKLLGMLKSQNKTCKSSQPKRFDSPKRAAKNNNSSSKSREVPSMHVIQSPANNVVEPRPSTVRLGRVLNASGHEVSSIDENSQTMRLGNLTQDVCDDKDIGERCVDHPHKRAKYFVLDEHVALCSQPDSDNRFCSKCAIRLVEKGMRIQELITSQKEGRKSEIEEFLSRLSDARRTTNATLESIANKKEDIRDFYTKLIEKVDLFTSVLMKILTEERTRVLEELRINQEKTFDEIQSMERQVNDRLDVITSIYQDIEKNFSSILNNIEIKPFKAIMGKYNEKLNNFIEFVETKVATHQVNIHKFPGFNKKAIDELKPMILGMFEKVVTPTSLVKRDISPKMRVKKPKALSQDFFTKESLNKSSLYISFENKEIFENAINTYRASSSKDSVSQDDAPRLRLERKPPTNTNKQGLQHHLYPDPSFSPNSSTQRATEEAEFMKKERESGDSVATHRTVKTPEYQKIKQNVSNTAHTKRPKSFNPFPEEQSLSIPVTSEFDKPLASLQQSLYEEKSTNRDFLTLRDSTVGTNSLQFHHRQLSCPSSQNWVNSIHESCESDFNFAFQSSQSTKKYKNILEKISTSQLRKNAIYSDLITKNPRFSPRSSAGVPDCNEERIIAADQLPKRDSVENAVSEERASVRDECKVEDSIQKEQKSCPPFFNFIENNKLTNPKIQQIGTNYQKTLFCCSPNFKENIQC